MLVCVASNYFKSIINIMQFNLQNNSGNLWFFACNEKCVDKIYSKKRNFRKRKAIVIEGE